MDRSELNSSSSSIEIIPGKLYFLSDDYSDRYRSNSSYVPFINDPALVYTAFFADFGPLDLGLTYKFCQQFHDALQHANEQHKALIYYAGSHPHKRANSAVLLQAYLIFVLNYSVEQSYGPFVGINPPFITYRDAGFCINTFPVTVLDCAKAMRKAINLNHFNYKTFSLQTFQHLSKLENGDISWIVPGKFIAFAGPVRTRKQIGPGVYTLLPQEYVPIFKSLNVTCVVRFNDKLYDRKVFLNNSIRHVDLYYEDGGNPTEQILQAFLQVCEQEKGAIAVHCKAGLGRTGTNIAAYMMKHYQYTAKEAIAWCRICRPGSIVGPQQQYLMSIEARMFQEGAKYREKHKLVLPSTLNLPSHSISAPTNVPSLAKSGSKSSLLPSAAPSSRGSTPMRRSSKDNLQALKRLEDSEGRRPSTSSGYTTASKPSLKATSNDSDAENKQSSTFVSLASKRNINTAKDRSSRDYTLLINQQQQQRLHTPTTSTANSTDNSVNQATTNNWVIDSNEPTSPMQVKIPRSASPNLRTYGRATGQALVAQPLPNSSMKTNYSNDEKIKTATISVDLRSSQQQYSTPQRPKTSQGMSTAGSSSAFNSTPNASQIKMTELRKNLVR